LGIRFGRGGPEIMSVTPEDYNRLVLSPALSILPERMDSQAARAMLIAIALQESGLKHRAQIRGPARSFLQFEPVGIRGVLDHPASAEYATGVCGVLGYRPDWYDLHPTGAFEHNDILAAAFARLLLWRLPEPLPAREQGSMAWDQYDETWRPGRPRRQFWPDNWMRAWEAVA